ncbi:YbaB/EbfC family nucleoid-associated protein [Catenulispora rubra]|uniref:YbaB/EbfC family nucleoid-associated protein n=1 Tax=Catenulispora rubra TaxID=280293 RepID=UPI0018923FC2|nr:YbaB/EbfC family nucleoid-associated protein [Catenulispora rubra]
MNLPFDGEVEALMEAYQRRRARTAELQQKIREISATASNPRQTVKVTVGAQGDLVGIEFPTDAYKRMAPKELVEAIMSVAAEAKTQAQSALRELMQPELPAGLDFDDLVQGKADLSKALSEGSSVPEAVRDYVATGRVPGRMVRESDG